MFVVEFREGLGIADDPCSRLETLWLEFDCVARIFVDELVGKSTCVPIRVQPSVRSLRDSCIGASLDSPRISMKITRDSSVWIKITRALATNSNGSISVAIIPVASRALLLDVKPCNERERKTINYRYWQTRDRGATIRSMQRSIHPDGVKIVGTFGSYCRATLINSKARRVSVSIFAL